MDGLYEREDRFDPFTVVLFKALQVIAFLFFIALLAMKPEANAGKIDKRVYIGGSPWGVVVGS